jgi:hypothetical protein
LLFAMPYKILHTLESCQEVAAKYPSRTQLKLNDPKVHDAARRRGWLDILFPPAVKGLAGKPRPPSWTPERVAQRAKLYASRKEMRASPDQWAYKVAMKHGWQYALPAPVRKRKFKATAAQPVAAGFFL